MTEPIRFKVGDRVQLNELGRSRNKRMRQRGTVVKLAKPASGGRSIEVLFDGNRQPTRMHRSYLELETKEK